MFRTISFKNIDTPHMQEALAIRTTVFVNEQGVDPELEYTGKCRLYRLSLWPTADHSTIAAFVSSMKDEILPLLISDN